MLVNCVEGIGDNLYARPFVKLLTEEGHDVHVRSVLPDLFSDLPVTFIDPGLAKYRTQQAAAQASKVTFDVNPRRLFDQVVNPHYGPKELRRYGILAHLEQAFGYQVGSTRPVMTLPINLPPHELPIAGREVAIIRPVTARSEWNCSTRAPNPNYVAWCARMLRDAGYYVISLADCVPGKEWIVGDEPPADLKLHRGELGLLRTLRLFKDAKVVVGGSGFIIPATLAARKPLFIIFGGRGQYDNPHKVLDLRLPLRHVGWAVPDKFCRCALMEHGCDKKITNLDDIFFKFMKDL